MVIVICCNKPAPMSYWRHVRCVFGVCLLAYVLVTLDSFAFTKCRWSFSIADSYDNMWLFLYIDCALQIRCDDCNEPFRKLKLGESRGSQLRVEANCTSCDNSFVWRSQPNVGRKAKGNVELAAAMFLTWVVASKLWPTYSFDEHISFVCVWHCHVTCRGQSYSCIAKWLKLANVQFFSSTTFYDYQHVLILPEVQRYFDNSLNESINLVKSRGTKISLSMSFSCVNVHATDYKHKHIWWRIVVLIRILLPKSFCVYPVTTKFVSPLIISCYLSLSVWLLCKMDISVEDHFSI